MAVSRAGSKAAMGCVSNGELQAQPAVHSGREPAPSQAAEAVKDAQVEAAKCARGRMPAGKRFSISDALLAPHKSFCSNSIPTSTREARS